MVSLNLLVLVACLFITQDVLGTSVKVVPEPQQVVKAGDPVTVICEIDVAIDHCSVNLPKGGKAVLSPNKPPYEGLAYPKDASMERGQCGFYTERVDDSMNGNYSCWLSLKSGNREVSGNMTIIVAKAPKPPLMTITPGSNPSYYRENETYTATCSVANGRPAAAISWFIGEDRITSGLSPADVQLTDPKLDLYTIKQTLTRSAQASDNNKSLKCVATHLLLVSNNMTQRQISVEFAPKPLPGPVENFGLGEGEQRTVVVTVLANPRPDFFWTIGDQKVMEGESDQSGKFHVIRSKMSDKVPGGWDTSLTIENLKKEDVEGVNYMVTASNGYGEERYTVIISTKPEPDVVEIGSGVIALIVIVVFAVLLLASIIIFARAKGRLCFAGKSGPQNAGECSDTESAEHHSSTKPKSLLPSVFKKKSDKVSADAPPNQTKDVTVNDEKVDTNEDEDLARLKPKNNEEGVVYAELDLQNSAPSRGLLVRPENDKTEYAEIIHAKDNK